MLSSVFVRIIYRAEKILLLDAESFNRNKMLNMWNAFLCVFTEIYMVYLLGFARVLKNTSRRSKVKLPDGQFVEAVAWIWFSNVRVGFLHLFSCIW